MGEIGLDFFVPALCTPEMRERQWFFYFAQLKLAQKHGLPVVLHVRRSADRLLKHLIGRAGEHHLGREGGSMTRVAEKTGLERTHLYRKLKQLGVEPGKLAKKGV